MSIYLLLDTAHRAYPIVIRELSSSHTGNFIPVLNLSGTKSLVQVKDNQTRSDWMFIERGLILDSGDKTWAGNVIRDSQEWGDADNPAFNDWQVHRDYLESKTTETEYKRALSDGRIISTRGEI